MILLDAEQLQRATGATRANAELYLPFLQGTCKAFDITSPRRLAGFLSQIGHESQNLSKVEENLNYSVDGLLNGFKRHRISEADARRYGRNDKTGQRANREAIANCLYGGEWGLKNLGNRAPGDGWKHRGMGLKQLTGLDNHTRCGYALKEDFVNHPERLMLPVNAALSAGWFWFVNRLNVLADKADVVSMTQVVNGGENGLEKRMALWNAGLQVFA